LGLDYLEELMKRCRYLNYLNNIFNGERYVVPKNIFLEYENEFKESNEWVSKRWFSQNARLLLKVENKNKFVISYFIPNINKYFKPLYLYVFFENEMVLKKKINQSGSFKETIAVPERYQKDRIAVYVKTSVLLKALGDSRNLGIPVRVIGFQ
jgi:hypothetical protein